MMTRESGKKREQIQLMSLDDLVPQDHLVQKLEAALDWNFIYELLEEIQKDRERHGKKPLNEAKIKQDDKLRKETIERDFALAKELHGFRYTQEYGQTRMAWKAALTFACINLKNFPEWHETPLNTQYSPQFCALSA